MAYIILEWSGQHAQVCMKCDEIEEHDIKERWGLGDFFYFCSIIYGSAYECLDMNEVCNVWNYGWLVENSFKKKFNWQYHQSIWRIWSPIFNYKLT